jgi:hypothetical protein
VLIASGIVAFAVYENQFQTVECSDVEAMQNVKTDENGNVTINDGVTVENVDSSTESNSSQNKN